MGPERCTDGGTPYASMPTQVDNAVNFGGIPKTEASMPTQGQSPRIFESINSGTKRQISACSPPPHELEHLLVRLPCPDARRRLTAGRPPARCDHPQRSVHDLLFACARHQASSSMECKAVGLHVHAFRARAAPKAVHPLQRGDHAHAAGRATAGFPASSDRQ